MANRKVLDGNITKDARVQIEALIKKGITPYRICKGSGVNQLTLDRFRKGKRITSEQLDKIGTWIKDEKH